MRRFTRLTNAFSKKVENHAAAVALYFMYYNFGRIHQTLRVTPAMEAGVADHVWIDRGNCGTLGLRDFMARISVSALVWVCVSEPHWVWPCRT